MDEFLNIPSLLDEESERLRRIMLAEAHAMAAVPEIDTFHRTGSLPKVFFTHLEGLYQAYDAYIRHNIAASRLKVMCGAGCSRCCRQPVRSVYIFEIINLYRTLRPNTDAYRRIHTAAVAAADEFQRELQRRLPADGAAEISGAHPAIAETHRVIAARATPCPLLDGDRCSAYAQRPISCRMFHSLTDPTWCTTERGDTFALEAPKTLDPILKSIADRLGPRLGMLSADLVLFGAERRFAPWTDSPAR